MPMTIVRDGETAEDVASRLASVEPRIAIDGTIVRALEESGITPRMLKKAILEHRDAFTRRKAPVDLGVPDVELHGRLEGDTFAADRLVTGPVTYFAKGSDGNPHLVDYTNMRRGPDDPVEDVAHLRGRPLREAIQHPCYRSRKPTIVKASRTFAKALHLSLEPDPVTI